MEKVRVDIVRWWHADRVLFTANVDASLSPGRRLGAAALAAIAVRADLRDANLTDANLTGANLTDAPVIHNIHQAVYAAASAPGALAMSDWHTCDTTHCRAGWVVTLAGEAGRELEARVSTPVAATMIYVASDPRIGPLPDFYCDNAAALADMKARADAEAARGGSA